MGDSVQLTAEVRDQDGRPLPSAVVSWTSNDDSVVAVMGSGLARAVGNGEATVTASAGGSVSAMVAITVRQIVTRVSVTPGVDTLVAGDSLRVSAGAFDAKGHRVSEAAFSWSSSGPAVATVDASGLVMAVSPGGTTVTAISGGVSGHMELLVITAAPTRIQVSPDSALLTALRDTVRLAVEAFDGLGRVIRDAIVSWQSNDEGVATVDSSGLVTATGRGTAEVTASVGEVSGAAVVTVRPRVDSIAVSPAPSGILPGDTVRLAAEAYDANARRIRGVEFSWSSREPAVAVVDSAGLVTTVSPGATEIVAASGGAAGHAELAVAAPAPLTVHVTPETVPLSRAGDTVSLSAEVRDPRGRVIERSPVSWSSDDESVAIVNVAGLVRGVGPGIATITALAGNARGSASIVVGNPDRAVLVAFYKATGGANWSQSDNWLTDAPIADWSGVRVDAHGRVSHLDLADSDITGRIPPALGYLTGLRELSLGRNRLLGTIPPELGELTNLIWMDLSGNQLTGVIPPALGNLARLGHLRLQNNRLRGSLPPALGNLASLTHLELNHNLLEGRIPAELASLRALEVLNLGSNGFLGAIPPELGSLTSLETLDLGGNELEGSIPVELANLRQLETLSLTSNRLTGQMPPELGGLSRLDLLLLDRNKLTGPIPPEFGNLDSLRNLSLSDNRLTGTIPAELGNLENLQVLHVFENKLTGISPSFGGSDKLESLWIHRNALRGSAPRSLLALSGLRSFVFSHNDGFCVPGSPAFVSWREGMTAFGPYCNESDQAVLVSLFDAMGGLAWTRSDGWLGSAALAEWFGVGTDTLGRVLTLDLTRNGLSGRLPSSIARLDRLARLRLGSNRLVGRLPLSLTRLSLEEFRYPDTRLCSPPDVAFNEWLNAIPIRQGTGETCASLSDRDVLETLYEETGGSGWLEAGNWLTEAPLGEWYGVTVDGEGRVVELSLGYNNLAGSIPAELGRLSRLQVLDLGGNAFSGTVPPELGDLGSLTRLWLGYSQLRGAIPAELGKLASLQRLSLEGNELTGSVPSELGNLSELKDLSLQNNRLSGPIPAEFGQLDNVHRLDLHDNRLTGRIPAALGDMASLSSLGLLRNELTGPIPPELGNLAELRSLRLSSNQLTDRIPSELGALRNLSSMELDGNGLTGRIPPEFGELEGLERLVLQENELTGPIPAELGKLEGLEELLIRANKLEGTIPPELGSLVHLTRFEVSFNAGLAGVLPASLTGLRRLETFHAAGTDLCSPAGNDFDGWLAGISTGRVARCPDGRGVSVAYLTQATQSRDFPVPLVAGEPALLRIFVTAARPTAEGIPPVRATFYFDGSETYVAEIPAQAAFMPTSVQEGNLETSANAVIPADVIRPGLEMVIEIDPGETLRRRAQVARRIPETGRLGLDVREMPVLDLTMIPFLWTEEPDSGAVESVRKMAADSEHPLIRDTRTMLPVRDVNLTAHAPVLSSSNDPYRVLDETRAIWVMEGGTGHYMGMMSGPLSRNIRGLAYQSGRTSFAIPNPSVIAHELGHNMSLGHAPCGGPRRLDPEYPYADGSIGSWGYDSRTGDRLVTPLRPDLMSYCDPPWISEYNFSKALHFRLRDADSSAEGPGSAAVRSLLLWGGADADRGIFLEPTFVVDAAAALPPAGGGEFELSGRTADGEVLFSLSFDMQEIADADGRSSFAFALPIETGWAGDLASIRLSGPEGTASLDRETNRPMVILRDRRSRQVRAFLRDPPPAAVAGGAVDIGALSPDRGVEALFSRGLPSTGEWRR